MRLGQTGLETRLGGVLSQHATEIEGWGNPLSGIPCTQSGTTITASGVASTRAFADYSNDDLVGSKMIFITSKSRELTVTSRTSVSSCEVDIPATVASPTDILLYRPFSDPATSLVRMLTKDMIEPLDGTELVYNADTKRFEDKSRSQTFLGTTTDAVPLDLDTLELPDDTAASFDISISAFRTDAVGFGAFRISGECTRGVGPASFELYGSKVVVMDRDAPQWAVAVEADTVLGGLRPKVVGKLAETIDWVAMVKYTIK